jgi:hypothetical protein
MMRRFLVLRFAVRARLWSVLPGLILFACLGVIPLQAQGPTLNLGTSTAKPGDPVDIPVTISGAEQPQMGSITLELTFPKDALHYVRASAGLSGEMAGAVVEGKPSDAPDAPGLSLLTVSIKAKQPIKPGILAYVHFRVATDAKKGMVPLKTRSVQAAALNAESQPLAKGRDGQVEIFDRDETIPLIGCFFFTH